MYPWLEATFAQIDRTFQQGHGHHALLCKAEADLGVAQLLTQIAQGILCREKPALDSCGQCHHCMLVTTNNHPDLHLLACEAGKTVSVDQVREVITQLQNHAQQDGNKVVVIPQAEKLTESAANALLKTLEEPSANTYFLLATDMSQPLMATIYSRCQVWTLTAPALNAGVAWLTSQGIAAQQAEVALKLSANRPLRAYTLIESEQLAVRKSFLRAFWAFSQTRDIMPFMAQFVLTDHALLDTQLGWLESVFVDCIKCGLGIEQHWVNSDLTAGIKRLVAQYTPPHFLHAEQLTRSVRRDLRDITAVNSGLLLLDFLTKLITDVFEV
ncbi:DNA polymerase III subunit delta' [Spirabiliibacterium falconis]|uniref:DNA polymerase III subunit delta' n=1 Tax=Spirabiliibacterium falconis TaxID=572023 RepID=UPI001AAD5AA2|nr:DNA polymerase III subunit delta' [Spirabiliibacterium falconis]MBE2894497.1 DNA polymerase III subunit delta' [Spirabiliibacterium falconis]